MAILALRLQRCRLPFHGPLQVPHRYLQHIFIGEFFSRYVQYIIPSLLMYILSLYVCFPILKVFYPYTVCYSRVFHDCCHCYFVAMLTL
jgi:hypothetical protein